jgi:hypothetical protein
LVAGSAARGHGATEGLDEVAAVFGPALSAASDDNLAYLQHLCASSGEGQVTKGQVTKDEFALWLLYLLGRIDATDIQVVRETFGTKKRPPGAAHARACQKDPPSQRSPHAALVSFVLVQTSSKLRRRRRALRASDSETWLSCPQAARQVGSEDLKSTIKESKQMREHHSVIRREGGVAFK